VNQSLLKQGVIVRPIAAYGMPDWLRVTIGTETENQRFPCRPRGIAMNHQRAGGRP
jgi:histidinol-phosphate/aromatic aminotransferase/cobyric acid decarboxylase-like protein